jgi:hypothetical protein
MASEERMRGLFFIGVRNEREPARDRRSGRRRTASGFSAGADRVREERRLPAWQGPLARRSGSELSLEASARTMAVPPVGRLGSGSASPRAFSGRRISDR